MLQESRISYIHSKTFISHANFANALFEMAWPRWNSIKVIGPQTPPLLSLHGLSVNILPRNICTVHSVVDCSESMVYFLYVYCTIVSVCEHVCVCVCTAEKEHYSKEILPSSTNGKIRWLFFYWVHILELDTIIRSSIFNISDKNVSFQIKVAEYLLQVKLLL